MIKPKKIEDLNALYSEAESEDKQDFAEKRSNILLVAGEHFSRTTSSSGLARLRSNPQQGEEQKLRITKNHIFRLANHYIENILAHAPSVKVVPNNESELQDQKDAELNNAVWSDIKYRHRFKEKTRQWCEDFVTLGEVAVKITWDPMKGKLLGYAPVQEKDGNYTMGEDGNYIPDEGMPVYSGDWDFERVYAFNLLRDPSADTMEDSKCLVIRKMVSTKELKQKYSADEEKLKYITEASKQEFVVFDASQGKMQKNKGQTLVREYYYRPCPLYPEGYFYITTESGILEEGPLPFGIFPIVWAGFDINPTVPRGKSVIKRARPFQAEINRAISQQATHQVTVGDDKIIYQAGTKLSPGALLPGVRGITYQGMPPTILPGRDGAQFTQYINDQIMDLYRACDAEELSVANEEVQADPWARLFATHKQRRKYSKYGEKFEQFLVDVAHVGLSLAKKYLPDDHLVQAIGRSEIINIPEFKSSGELTWKVRVEPTSETLETQMGKQLTMNHILQYVGKQLDKDSIGKVMRNMPFGNIEQSFDDLTLDYDVAVNLILALDRGEPVMPTPYDNAEYLLARLNHRRKKPDFKFLPPQIQDLYEQVVQAYEQILADQEAKVMAMKNEYIPTDGPMVGVDMYVKNEDPTKDPKRAKLPGKAIEWLVGILEKQGNSLEKFQNMETQNLASLAEVYSQSQGQMAGAPGMPTSSNGQANPF